jgi:hypothetical protein
MTAIPMSFVQNNVEWNIKWNTIKSKSVNEKLSCPKIH